MHERELADKTIARALEVGMMCKEFSCKAIVTNPDTKPANGRKSDDELAVQAESLNRMGRSLAAQDFQLRVHHHTAELVEDAREWRHILRNTDPKYVTLCLDLEHAFHGGVDPNALIKEAASRVTEIHLRNKTKETPLEALEDGDIDHYAIAATLKKLKLEPLVVIELAYHADTVITRSLKDDLRLSRIYAEKVFAL
jgi:inosose dehydratase